MFKCLICFSEFYHVVSFKQFYTQNMHRHLIFTMFFSDLLFHKHACGREQKTGQQNCDWSELQETPTERPEGRNNS